MKNHFHSLLLATLMVMGSAFSTLADITIRVNMADVVTFSFSGGRGSAVLDAGDNVFTAEECQGELRVIRDDYDIECRNLTTGEDLQVNQYQQYSKINVNSYLVNDGDVLDVTVTEVKGKERTVRFVFESPEAGYVAYLTNYDISGDQCIGDEYPLDSNEDEYFYPEDDGTVYVPYDYYRRIRIRSNMGYSILSARNPKETNPHYDGYKPNARGVIEMALVELNVNDVVEVKTAEHGMFSVKGMGSHPEEIEMLNTSDYQRLEVTSELLPVEFTGQTYTIRIRSDESVGSPRCEIDKVEVTNSGLTRELEGNGNRYLYLYTPTKGDEVVIYLTDATGVAAIDKDAVARCLYRMDGTKINKTGKVPAGIYIEKGRKVIVK